MWGVSGALDGAGGVRTACSPLQMLQGLAPAQSSGSVCVCACAGRTGRGRAAGEIPGLPGALAHTGWAPLMMSFYRLSGVKWRLNQGQVASKWWNGGSDWLTGKSEPRGPCSEGVKGALISGGAEPGTGERSGGEQVSEGAVCLALGGAHAGGGGA